ncbi:hypothetical protein ABD91_00400 [Lysinibacillus sphaericus]|uniref:hypothetical protein n=1 Tax=Lysinibacillus sphaericus TaxID=1421 RepID=UPI0018CD1112|nr:hypothetical protein [Lysinibacillus sphaericus]MBG9689392.1 hypothetical protein [Lysinibacillus sphaericus]
MEDKVIFIRDIIDENGNIVFKKDSVYRLLLEDESGFYVAYKKKGNECSHFPKDSLKVDFDFK